MKWQAFKDNWLYYTVLLGLCITSILTSMSKVDKPYVDTRDSLYFIEIKAGIDRVFYEQIKNQELLNEILEANKK